MMKEKIETFLRQYNLSRRATMLVTMMIFGVITVLAQNGAGDYSAGTDALTQVTTEIVKYVPIVVKLCYAIAGVVAVVGAISVYIAMSASVMVA